MNNIAMVVHLYYIEMLEDLCAHINELRKHIEFDVLVTTQAKYADPGTLRKIAQELQAVDVEFVENRGRDILPFLDILPKLAGYEYACKVHTKDNHPEKWRGPANARHKMSWRDHLWDAILSPDKAKAALAELSMGTVMYAPEDTWYSHVSGLNTANMAKIGSVLDVQVYDLPFIAGSMFWFKPKTMQWFSSANFPWRDMFEDEEGATDGKMEHAFERVFLQLAVRGARCE